MGPGPRGNADGRAVPNTGMVERGWRDLIVGDRMQVDEQFAGTLQESGFSRTEWGMIMTAVEFEVEGEGESARLVADTSRIDVILPELEEINDRMGGYPGGSDRSGGLFDSLRSSLGRGSSDGVDPQRRQEAVPLAEEYARRLQGHLEGRGRWERVRRLAAEEARRRPSDEEEP